ncbi:3D domain-containing protein [Petrotoga sp. 9PWA.NaAc.5.4]|uniref:3D domain-containing protein n=1 Tax=Petrotoga sp. 9PWA.NaAc.5.4 TaxID=1434328 RepID=UPI000CB1C7F3|nr:3D domain-containing protein [Petrotoga sp. 9PWA.NaAc.5.4]PNR92789.1 peptidase M23 [Petrotoga sp. 9PWA.NaAc.5.4]
MKKISFFLIILTLIFLFSSCTIFQPAQGNNNLPSQNAEIEALKRQLSNIETRLIQMETEINTLSDKIYQNSINYSYDYIMVKSLKEQYDYLQQRVVTLEDYLYEGRSYEDIDKLLDLDKRVSILESSKKNDSSINNLNVSTIESDQLEVRIMSLENEIKEIQNFINNGSKSDQKVLLDNINSLNERVNVLEQSYKNSEFYFLQNGNLKELIQKEVEDFDIEKYVESIVEYKAEETISKFYYKTQSEDIKNVKSLETKIDVIEKQLNQLNYEVQKISTQPPNSLNERYLGQIQDLELKINSLYSSIGEAEINSILGNNGEIRYIVKSGDTLISISNAFNLGNKGVQIIMQANNLTSTNIRVGQELVIPVSNLENYIKWPFEKTLPNQYDKIVIRFGERNGSGISSGIGVMTQSEQIFSILPGRVIETGKLNNGNFYIKIDHGNSIISVMSNISTLSVSSNKWIDSTTVIGSAKNGDVVTLEIWKNGEPKDPLKLFYKEVGEFRATYYTEWDDKIVYSPTFRLTKSGDKPISYKTIAADPSVLPLGSIVYIPELAHLPNDGFFVVNDTGGQIKGNKIDIYVNDVRLANQTEEKLTVYLVGQNS